MTSEAEPPKPLFTAEQEAWIAGAIEAALKASAFAIEAQVRRQLAGRLLGRDPDVFDLPNTRLARSMYWSGSSPDEIREAVKNANGSANA